MRLTTKKPKPKREGLHPTARENIDELTAYQDREEADIPRVQAAIERASRFFGSPSYFVFVVASIVGWIVANEWGMHAGWSHVDVPPFFYLQGLVSANALLLTIAVLIRQDRMASLSARRAHLDLHVNLLTEKKVSKALEAIHEIARSMGHAPDESEAGELATAADPKAILAALKEAEGAEGGTSTSGRK